MFKLIRRTAVICLMLALSGTGLLKLMETTGSAHAERYVGPTSGVSVALLHRG